MSYRDEMEDLSRKALRATIAAQDCPDVTITEYEELRAIRNIIERLRHKQWQRDTFTKTIAEKVDQ